MDSSSIICLISIIILIFLSGFFSSSETAISSLSRVRIKNYIASGDKRAKYALKLVDNFDDTLSAILIGNNIVNIASASLGTVLFTSLVGDSGAVISTIVLTIVILIFGEVMPKSLAKSSPERFAMATARIIYVLIRIFSPLIFVLKSIIKLFNKRIKAEDTPSVTEEELKYIIEEIEDEGVLNEHESELVQSAIDFDDITVEEILTHRVDVEAIDITDYTSEEIKDMFFETGFSRLPVYEKNIDKIIGVINEKDFLKEYIYNKELDIKHIIKKVIFVPPKKLISRLMKELQQQRMHMAVVTDPFGGTIGIITLEDIIEELVGEIWDESDTVELELEQLTTDVYRASGDMNVYDLFEQLEISDDEYEGTSQSISGWALDVFKQIPEQDEFFDYKNLHIIVEEINEQRIISFLIRVDNISENVDE